MHYLYKIKIQLLKMKIKLLIAIAFLSITSFGQLTGKVPGLNITKPVTVNDTVIKVVYKNNKISKNPPAVFFNSKLVSFDLLKTINPESIATVNVIKRDTIIDSVKYYGQLYIQGKITNNHNYMSLNEFKRLLTGLFKRDRGFADHGEQARLGMHINHELVHASQDFITLVDD